MLDRVQRNDPDEFEDARDSLQALIAGWVTQQSRHGGDLKYRQPGAAGGNAPRSWLIQAAEEEQTGEFPKSTLNSLRDVEKASGLYFKNFKRPGNARVGT